MVQTIGNAKAGGAKLGIFKFSKFIIPFLERRADTIPTINGIKRLIINSLSYFRFILSPVNDMREKKKYPQFCEYLEFSCLIKFNCHLTFTI